MAEAITEVPSSQLVTDLIQRIFRTNGALLAAGDRLVAPVGLTSARWQLLGIIVEQKESRSVAQLARLMSVTRQAVQRIANELEADGVITFCANPRHKRAHLVEMTQYGRDLFDRAMVLQQPWASRLGCRLSIEDVVHACATLDSLLLELHASG